MAYPAWDSSDVEPDSSSEVDGDCLKSQNMGIVLEIEYDSVFCIWPDLTNFSSHVHEETKIEISYPDPALESEVSSYLQIGPCFGGNCCPPSSSSSQRRRTGMVKRRTLKRFYAFGILIIRISTIAEPCQQAVN